MTVKDFHHNSTIVLKDTLIFCYYVMIILWHTCYFIEIILSHRLSIRNLSLFFVTYLYLIALCLQLSWNKQLVSCFRHRRPKKTRVKNVFF